MKTHKFTSQQEAYFAQCLDKLPETISAIIFDFDGVFTNNKVFVHEDGSESVQCSRGDGLRIGIFSSKYPEVPLMVLSKERNPVVQARCTKLSLSCVQAMDDKLSFLQNWTKERNIGLDSIVYLGNDLNDIECISNVGCGVAVSDAYPEVLAVADFALNNSGGNGAVRELLEIIDYKLMQNE